MGMISNAANAAAADAVAKQQEMQMLLRGKTSEQQAVIKFFYGASGGCMHAGGMTVEEYQKKDPRIKVVFNEKQLQISDNTKGRFEHKGNGTSQARNRRRRGQRNCSCYL